MVALLLANISADEVGAKTETSKEHRSLRVHLMNVFDGIAEILGVSSVVRTRCGHWHTTEATTHHNDDTATTHHRIQLQRTTKMTDVILVRTTVDTVDDHNNRAIFLTFSRRWNSDTTVS